MTTAIGTVGQGEFMSSKSLVEAAKIILSARPEGLSEDMLVHILLLDDRPFTGLGAHVYGTRSKSKNSLGNKGLSALRRTKGMRKQEGRWIYTGPPPAAPKSDDGEAVVSLTPPPSPSSRCCKGCGAILRKGNFEDYCWPCEPPRITDTRVRDCAEPKPKRPARRPKWTPEKVIREIQKWHEETGQVPVRVQWEKARKKGETRPTASVVCDVFGTWSDGMRAAGLTPRVATRGRPRSGASPMWRQVLNLLPASAEDVGSALGRGTHLTRDALYRMEKAGWVYRENRPVNKRIKRGDVFVIWHPMPEGMERAA